MDKSPQFSLLKVFATPEEQASFLGWMRLLDNDVGELSSVLSILLSLSKRPPEGEPYVSLNRHPDFWNAILLGLQTNLFVVVGRIYDTRNGAYLKRILKFTRGGKHLKDAGDRFELIALKHSGLIKKINDLRNNIFAHSAENSALHIAFGFEGLTWDLLDALCKDLISACDSLGNTVFEGRKFGPRLRADQLDHDLVLASEAWSSLVQRKQG